MVSLALSEKLQVKTKEATKMTESEVKEKYFTRAKGCTPRCSSGFQDGSGCSFIEVFGCEFKVVPDFFYVFR
jgi:hypothetical protein